MNRLANIHPGEILQEEFLTPLNITPYKLAKAIGVQQTRIGEILRGTRSITADTAIRLGQYFRMTPQFWLNLQNMYDLEVECTQEEKHVAYKRIRTYDEDREAVTA